MGAKLVSYYEKAAEEFGPAGRMNLALLTSIPSARAATEEDSPANIQKFEAAFAKLKQSK